MQIRTATFLAGCLMLASCASGGTVTVTQELTDDAGAPFERVLVISLFDSFDARRYLETEIVNAMAAEGVEAIASTTMMNSLVPIERKTFVDMIQNIDADSVLLTQLTSYKVVTTEKDSSPQATYNYWPTYYWNVWQVELTEYVEPPRMLNEHRLVLASQMLSVKTREPAWAMETAGAFVEVQEDGLDYRVFIDEAETIVGRLKRDRVIDR